MSIYKLKCPQCGQSLRVRNSIAQHPLLRDAYLQCTSITCGEAFRGIFEITHEISPPSNPNPEIRLPNADAAIRLAASGASL
jgi:hypothetical protein